MVIELSRLHLNLFVIGMQNLKLIGSKCFNERWVFISSNDDFKESVNGMLEI